MLIGDAVLHALTRASKVVFLPLNMIAFPPVREAFNFSCPLYFKAQCLTVFSEGIVIGDCPSPYKILPRLDTLQQHTF